MMAHELYWPWAIERNADGVSVVDAAGRRLFACTALGEDLAGAVLDAVHKFLHPLADASLIPYSEDETATDVRGYRQRQVLDWCRRCFGRAAATDPHERAARLVEEALELAQAMGVPADTVRRLCDYVYGRPPGSLRQEIGGVGVALLALAECCEASADLCEIEELQRILSKTPEHFAVRQDAKAKAGIAAPAARDKPVPLPPLARSGE